MRYTRLKDQSEDYLAARQDLRLAEIELLKHREQVAELRRTLPDGPQVEDYLFAEGPSDLKEGDEPTRSVRLSELFDGPRSTLVAYHLMYGRAQTSPCPMCTMWIDGFNGVAHHITRNIGFVVVAAAALEDLRAHARDRRWDRLRLLSAADNTFQYDLGAEDEQGHQGSAVSVFTRDDSGVVRHSYTTFPRWSETDNQRGIDLLSPVWHLLDLTPDGRGDWYPSLTYENEAGRSAA